MSLLSSCIALTFYTIEYIQETTMHTITLGIMKDSMFYIVLNGIDLNQSFIYYSLTKYFRNIKKKKLFFFILH